MLYGSNSFRVLGSLPPLEQPLNLISLIHHFRYAICGDQTLRNFVKLRPSTMARLANIDGVNQVPFQIIIPVIAHFSAVTQTLFISGVVGCTLLQIYNKCGHIFVLYSCYPILYF